MARRTNSVRNTRRNFFHVGGLSLLGLSLPNLLARESLSASSKEGRFPARNVIMIWLSGGPSTIDMWDLKPQANSAIRGEFNPIPTSAEGIEICEHLPKIAEQMHHCTLVRSVHHTIAEHGQGTEYVMTGNPISPSIQYPGIQGSAAPQRRKQMSILPL